MAALRLRRRVTRWGNSYGIRLTKEELKKLKAREKDEVTVEIRREPEPTDLSRVTFLHLGGRVRRDHDDVLGEGLLGDR